MNQVEGDIKVVFQSEVLKLIQERPGISIGAIQKHFSPRSKQTIAATLGRFRRMGVATSREDKWYPVDPWDITPEFAVLASLLLSELNSLMPGAREIHLAKRLQEEFQKNSGLYEDKELIDKETWLKLQVRREELAREIEIRRDAALLFGTETTKDWSIGECKTKITEVYDRWWHASGGTGSHPMSPK